MDGWTPERALLTALVDAVQGLAAITVAVNSTDGKIPEVPRLPRPVTGIERAALRRRDRARDELLAKLLPHRPPETA